MNGWTYGRTNARMNEYINDCMNEWKNGQTYELNDEVNERIHELINMITWLNCLPTFYMTLTLQTPGDHSTRYIHKIHVPALSREFAKTYGQSLQIKYRHRLFFQLHLNIHKMVFFIHFGFRKIYNTHIILSPYPFLIIMLSFTSYLI